MINFLFFIFCTISLAICAQHQNQEPQKELNKTTMQDNSNSTPESTIKSLIDAMEANDGDKIRSLFHDNASQAYGDGPSKSGKAFFKWLDSDIIDRKGHVEGAHFTTTGNEVVVTGQYSSEGYTNKANFLFFVKEGKIMSWQMRY
ncbi:ketosteroid isomerase-like protein [Nonlabens dokdonensis]|nr:ketosteroid isomerase-like protein [Nonlabens dokdonensis]